MLLFDRSWLWGRSLYLRRRADRRLIFVHALIICSVLQRTVGWGLDSLWVWLFWIICRGRRRICWQLGSRWGWGEWLRNRILIYRWSRRGRCCFGRRWGRRREIRKKRRYWWLFGSWGFGGWEFFGSWRERKLKKFQRFHVWWNSYLRKCREFQWLVEALLKLEWYWRRRRLFSSAARLLRCTLLRLL